MAEPNWRQVLEIGVFAGMGGADLILTNLADSSRPGLIALGCLGAYVSLIVCGLMIGFFIQDSWEEAEGK